MCDCGTQPAFPKFIFSMDSIRGLIINTEEGGKDEEATEDKEAEQG